MSQEIRVALAGNPNSGKTTIFNALTGSRQHVGNYPGVTVEKRTGTFDISDTRVHVTDLPGTYSLSSYSPEEVVAQRELVDAIPDVMVVVVDSTTLKRSLVLLAQIMQAGDRIVLCLNMADEARTAGQKLDKPALETLLGFPVVETVGHKGQGISELKDAIYIASQLERTPSRLVLGERLDTALAAITFHIAKTDIPKATHPWHAVKLLLDDPLYVDRLMEKKGPGKRAVQQAALERKKLEDLCGEDISLFVTQRYYGFVDGLLRETLLRSAHIDTRALSDRIDAFVVNKVAGIPVFLLVMYAIFWLTFTVGEYPMEWIEDLFAWSGDAINGAWPEGKLDVLRSLIVDGILAGVGGVVGFLPNIILLFLGLAVLEDTGYMARAAFLTDRLMHRFGLHGRSFIPMITGFGCTIPGIMATRTMENEKDRLTTMLVLPLMSCGARLPIWMLLIPAFFPPEHRASMLFGIYAIGIVLAFLLALLLRSTLLRGEEAPFVMELPPYRVPTMRSVVGRIIDRSGAYLKKAGTIILAISMLMWVLTSYPKPPEVVDVPAEQQPSALEYSIAGRIGKFIEPAIAPLGFDWKIGVATLGAFAAKEVFVSQLGVIYAMDDFDEDDDEDIGTLRDALARDYTPLVGFSLMLFLLIATPCMATVAITRREAGSWKWAFLQFFGLTAIAWVISFAFFQIGSLLL